jgi:hypothetical protein
MTIGRARTPDEAALRLAQLTARHDQAGALIDEHLRRNKGDKKLCDVLLDIRLALQGAQL